MNVLNIRDQIRANTQEIARLIKSTSTLTATLAKEGINLTHAIGENEPKLLPTLGVGDKVKVTAVDSGSGAVLGKVYVITMVDVSDAERPYKLDDLYWPLKQNIKLA